MVGIYTLLSQTPNKFMHTLMHNNVAICHHLLEYTIMKLSKSLPIVLVVLAWALFNLQRYYTREESVLTPQSRNGLLITIAPKSRQENHTDDRLQAGTASNQSCCWIGTKHKVEYLCSTEHSSLVSYCSCSDYLMCKLVMVTALSSNHFEESIDFFGSVHTLS